MATILTHVVDSSALVERTSPATGRAIRLNADTSRFALCADWSAQRLAAAKADFDQLLQGARSVRGRASSARIGASRACAALCEPVFNAGSADAMASAVDPLLALLLRDDCPVEEVRALVQRSSATTRSHAGAKSFAATVVSRLGWMLTTLWRHGLLLAPGGDGVVTRRYLTGDALPAFDSGAYGHLAPVILGVTDVPRPSRRAKADRDRTSAYQLGMARLLLTTQGVVEVGDLTPETLAPVEKAVAYLAPAPGLFCDAINRLQQRTYDRELPLLRALLPGQGAKPKGSVRRIDPSFAWMDTELSAFPHWRTAAVRWADEQESRLGLGRLCETLGMLLSRLLRAPGAPAQPLAFCALTYDGPSRITAVLESVSAQSSHRRRALSTLTSFFASVLGAEATGPDGALDGAYRNPTTALRIKKGRNRGKGQTQREPVRPWLVREIREILATDEWARTLADDYFVHTDPASGLALRTWSPVRLELFRLRFLLPLRTTQVQLLDSGEGDSRIWVADPAEPLQGSWVENGGPWAPPRGDTRQLGLLRPIYDPDHDRELTGIYISTNKTGDVTSDFETIGYEIAWESADVVALFLRVRDFQAHYNPSRGPLKRTEISTSRDIATPDVDAILPAHHFLFRDPCRITDPMEPLTTERLRNFWYKLLDECERRVNARLTAGDPSGRSATLITKRSPSGFPLRAKHDLHTLRVTGITELAVAGCPLQVLMMLAGHATWVMTLYYVKLSPSDIHREISSARERAREAMDAETWDSLIASGELDRLRALPFGNSEDGLAGRERTSPDAWRLMDFGECPNGGTLCHMGGEVIHRNPRDGDRHGPVPGGQRNCTSCRFFTYTPVHIMGLIARANALALEVKTSGERLRAAEKTRRELFAAAAAQPGDPVLRARMARADGAVEEAEAQAVMVAKELHSTLRCITRCKAAILRETEAARRGDDNRRLPVLLNGTMDDLTVSFERCSDYDLWARIAADSEAHPSVDPAPAALRRAARLDRVLHDAGEGAVFATLSDEERVTVGNMYARWLRMRLGPTDHAAVISGERTLRELGLLEESDRMLAPHRIAVAPRDALTSLSASGPRALPAGAPVTEV